MHVPLLIYLQGNLLFASNHTAQICFFLQPKIEWMKNQMIIGDDPKYRQICVQGICSLEIRKPGNFDGGVYSCRAKNNFGEATVSCKLEVKRKSGS